MFSRFSLSSKLKADAKQREEDAKITDSKGEAQIDHYPTGQSLSPSQSENSYGTSTVSNDPGAKTRVIDTYPYSDIKQSEIGKFAEQMYSMSLAEDAINETYTFNPNIGKIYKGPYFEDKEDKKTEDEMIRKKNFERFGEYKDTYDNPNIPKFKHPEVWISNGSKKTSEAVITSMRFLENNGLELKNCVFCECMSYGAEACCLVSSFRIRWALAIEISEESRQLGWSRLRACGKWAMEHTEMCVSRFQDHLALDANVAYFDTAHIGTLDEGPIIRKFLVCCEKLLGGTFVVLLTRCTDFNPKDYDCAYLQTILRSKVSRGNLDEANLWICKIVFKPVYSFAGTAINAAANLKKNEK